MGLLAACLNRHFEEANHVVGDKDSQVARADGYGGNHHRNCTGTNQGNHSKAAGSTGDGRGTGKELLLLIDTEKKGKISKQEWMRFMEAEFDRLDKAKNGELDVEELTRRNCV